MVAGIQEFRACSEEEGFHTGEMGSTEQMKPVSTNVKMHRASQDSEARQESKEGTARAAFIDQSPGDSSECRQLLTNCNRPAGV